MHANIHPKKAGVAILSQTKWIPEQRVLVGLRRVISCGYGSQSIHQEGITIQKVYAPYNRTSTYVKEKLKKL